MVNWNLTWSQSPCLDPLKRCIRHVSMMATTEVHSLTYLWELYLNNLLLWN